MQKLYEFIN